MINRIMKKNGLFQSVILIIFSIIFNSLQAQELSEKVKSEITEALNIWNNAAKNSNTELMMSLFDDSENIMLIGSDSAEIWKGKDQIRGHLNSIFPNESVSWEMNRIDIDGYGNTAWVFVDGSIIISTDTGENIKAPYRFTGILIKKNKEWKWRLFNGSNP
jgi:ketosteroid isomerase-like protein